MEDLMQAGVIWEAERNSNAEGLPPSPASTNGARNADDEGIADAANSTPPSNVSSVEMERRPPAAAATASPLPSPLIASSNSDAIPPTQRRTPTTSPRSRPSTPSSPSERSLEGVRGTGRIRLFSAEMHRFFEDDIVNGTSGPGASAVALKKAALTIIGIHRFLSHLSANKLPEQGSVVDHVVKVNAIVQDVLEEDRTGQIHEFLIAECGWRGDRFTCEEDYSALQHRTRAYVTALEQASAGVATEAAAAAAAADEAEFFASHGKMAESYQLQRHGDRGGSSDTGAGAAAAVHAPPTEEEHSDAVHSLPPQQRGPGPSALSRVSSSGSDGGVHSSASTATEYTPSSLVSPISSLFNSFGSRSRSPPPFTGGYDSSAEDGAGPASPAPTRAEVDAADAEAAAAAAAPPPPAGGAGGGSGAAPPASPSKKKSGESFLNRMWSQAAAAATDWWVCSPGSSRGDGPSAAAMPKDFEVSFEDIVELEFLGSGALGTVFSGVLDGEKVAIKKFRDAKHVGEEAQDLKSLSHPNIVALRGICAQEPVYCLVMELCLRSVHDVIKGTTIGPELVCNWAKQVACGMEYLHGQNVVHRDLKTPNVLIGSDERTLKISDFGTSRQTESKSKATAMTFCGSVAWMSPEMVRSEPCSQMVDVWSFGVVLWELLTGQQPYSGVDTAAILYRIGTGGTGLPVASTTPLAFSLLLKQCFNKDPKHRPKFRQILLHLQIIEDDSGFVETPNDVFYHQQQSWKRENDDQFSKMKIEDNSDDEKAEAMLRKQRERELQHAEDIRRLYEERLGNATQLLVDLRSKMKEVNLSAKQVRRAKSGGGATKFTVGGGSTKPRRRRKSYSKGDGSGGGGGSSLLRSAVAGSGKGRSSADFTPSSSGASTPQEAPPPGSKAGKLHRSAERLLRAKLMAVHATSGADAEGAGAASKGKGSSGKAPVGVAI